MNYSEEKWLPIIGFEGKYLISDHGRVKSNERIIGNGKGYVKKEAIKTPQFTDDGYYQVGLTVGNRKNKSYTIARLVAKHFIKCDITSDELVCHRDGNRLNNHVSNLYIGDVKSNTEDRYRHGSTSLTPDQIKEIRSLKKVMSQAAIAKVYNTRQGTISRIINNKRSVYIGQ